MHVEQKSRVLLLDDDPALVELLSEELTARGFEVQALSESRAALAAVDAGAFDALVTDLRMPRYDGLTMLDHAKRAAREAPVIVMTAHSGVDSAVECIRRGAYHYLTKPFKADELVLFLERALQEAALRAESRVLKQELRGSMAGIVGASPAMREVISLIHRIAAADVPVLVLGETGTGKGLVARALHAASDRVDGPFVSLNCAAVPETLLESELFGHAKGAFTGANTARAGLFMTAQHGTLFLDEIAEMSPALQAKLLHVLETGTLRAVGDTQERSLDVRIIAATHRDLRARVADGSFREDLLYRLDVVSVELPPLRHRAGDIPLLIEHFFAEYRAKYPRAVAERLSSEALATVTAYEFPGNVRELAHLIERLVLLHPSVEVPRDALPARLLSEPSEDKRPIFGNLALPLREVQRLYVLHTFERLGGHKRDTCEALGIEYKTLMRYLQ